MQRESSDSNLTSPAGSDRLSMRVFFARNTLLTHSFQLTNTRAYSTRMKSVIIHIYIYIYILHPCKLYMVTVNDIVGKLLKAKYK
jgi:hypothetical protein